MTPRLGVNIDHVATLRQQRGESYPSIHRAALLVLESGADQITIHLREDRRHIQDADVAVVHEACRTFKKPLNFEMGVAPEIVALACHQRPEWVCLVPEKREERTTEGGLALTDPKVYARLRDAIGELRSKTPATKISLFVEAHAPIMELSLGLGVDAVEIHTGDYAIDYLKGNDTTKYLALYQGAHKIMKQAGLGFHAGHGLTDASVGPLVKQGLFEEYNIGHWIISESVFRGLGPVVADLRAVIRSES